MAIEIVSFPINSMVDLSIVMLNYQVPMSAAKKKNMEIPWNIRWLEPSMLESSWVPIDLLNPIVFMLYPLLS